MNSSKIRLEDRVHLQGVLILLVKVLLALRGSANSLDNNKADKEVLETFSKSLKRCSEEMPNSEDSKFKQRVRT